MNVEARAATDAWSPNNAILGAWDSLGLRLHPDTRQYVFLRAFLPSVNTQPASLLLQDEPLPLTPPQAKRFQKDHVVTVSAGLLHPLSDLVYIEGEGTFPHLLSVKNWNDRFQNVEMPGLRYLLCQYALGDLLLAWRDDPTKQVRTRVWSMVSRWEVARWDAFKEYGLPRSTRYVTLFYPVLDGIGYDIGTDMRNGIFNYSEKTVYNLAEQTARAALLIDRSESQPDFGEVVFQIVSIPGALRSDDRLKPGSAITALLNCGLKPEEHIYPSEAGKSYKIFYRVTALDKRERLELLAFNPGIIDRLRPVWKELCDRQQPLYTSPPKDLY